MAQAPHGRNVKVMNAMLTGASLPTHLPYSGLGKPEQDEEPSLYRDRSTK